MLYSYISETAATIKFYRQRRRNEGLEMAVCFIIALVVYGWLLTSGTGWTSEEACIRIQHNTRFVISVGANYHPVLREIRYEYMSYATYLIRKRYDVWMY